MNAYIMSSKDYYTETVSKVESREELWADEDVWNDEDFWNDLIDAINNNFVMEVKASQNHNE